MTDSESSTDSSLEKQASERQAAELKQLAARVATLVPTPMAAGATTESVAAAPERLPDQRRPLLPTP